jgi:tRNA A58 N-methylase Trm61
MASHATDAKLEPAYHDSKIEDVAEKTSNSSAELEAQHVELDESESARVLRKVDMRLVPMLALLYLVAFIDRSNSTCTMLQKTCSENANLFQSEMPKLPA